MNKKKTPLWAYIVALPFQVIGIIIFIPLFLISFIPHPKRTIQILREKNPSEKPVPNK
jgi:hypothetical protein